MLVSNSGRKWKEEEHLETRVWAGALVVGWFSIPGSLQSDLAFLLLSRCPEVFPRVPGFALGTGLRTMRIGGSGGRTGSWIALTPTPTATFTAAGFRSLSDFINLLVTLVSRYSCLCLERFGKGQSPKEEGGWDSSLPEGSVYRSLLWVQGKLVNLLLVSI